MKLVDRSVFEPTKRYVVLVDCGRYFNYEVAAIENARNLQSGKRAVVVAEVLGYVEAGGSYKERV